MKKLISPKIKKETGKAYLIEIGEGQLEEHWFPKSVCYPEYPEAGGYGELMNVYVDDWFVEQKELIPNVHYSDF